MEKTSDIDVTDEMVTAGVELLVEWDFEFCQGPLSSARELMAELFVNMANASA